MVFSLESLFITNVVLLSTGPILLLLLAYSKHSVRLSRRIRSRYFAHPDEDGVEENVAYGERALATLKWFGSGFWSSTKLWVALAITIGLQAALIAGYVNLNPFVSFPFLLKNRSLTQIISGHPLSSFPSVHFCFVVGLSVDCPGGILSL